MTSKIVLDAWYAQPIHCPFCGVALTSDEQVGCKHLLYVLSAANFVHRTDRFDQLAGINPDDNIWWPEFNAQDKEKYGKPIDVASNLLEQLVSAVEFEIRGPTDSTLVGFAPFENELCIFGREHKSPYSAF